MPSSNGDEMKLENQMVGTLYCPFISRISPHAIAVQSGTLAWLDQMGFTLEGSLLDGLEEVGGLVARTYPDANLEMLQLASDWTTLVFLLDDLVERIRYSQDVILRNLIIMGAFEGLRSESRDPILIALWDINRRLIEAVARAGLPPEWRLTFNSRFQEWLGAHVWEAENRGARKIPRVEAYVHMRQFTVGMYFEFTLAELIGGYCLPEAARTSPAFQQLERMAVNLIAWSNDILTLNKELTTGEVHNLILSIKQTRAMTASAARMMAINMHNLEAEQFLNFRDSFTESRIWSVEVLQYIVSLQHWIGGHVQWGIDSKRYNLNTLTVPPPEDKPTYRP